MDESGFGFAEIMFTEIALVVGVFMNIWANNQAFSPEFDGFKGLIAVYVVLIAWISFLTGAALH